MSHDERIDELARFVRQRSAGMTRREFLRHGAALGLSLPTILGVLTACGVEPPPQAAAPEAPASPQPTAVFSRPAAPIASPTGPTAAPTAAPTQVPATPTPAAPTRFAVIADFGMEGEPAQAVAALVASHTPEFVVSAGDNNYPGGDPGMLDANVGQYYHAFLSPYTGAYGQGADRQRFFPVLGNHDWQAGDLTGYIDYFSTPGNGRYYTFGWGPAEFFMVDSMPGEPDGIEAESVQGLWLQQALAASAARWKLVVMHHPPYSSGHHGSSPWMQWPYKAWGADIVLTGHDHSYERLIIDGLPYLVNGLGGGARYAPGNEAVAGSQAFFNADHGALLAEVDETRLALRFVTRAGEQVDAFELTK